jgi:hypothetical protein
LNKSQPSLGEKMLTDALIKNVTTMVDDPLLIHVVIFLIVIFLALKLLSGFDSNRSDSTKFLDGLKDLRKDRRE